MFGKNAKNPIDHRGQTITTKHNYDSPKKVINSGRRMDIETVSQKVLDNTCDQDFDYSSAARVLPRVSRMDIESCRDKSEESQPSDVKNKRHLKNKLLDVFSLLLLDLELKPRK